MTELLLNQGKSLNKDSEEPVMSIFHDGEDLIRQPIPRHRELHWSVAERAILKPTYCTLEHAMLELMSYTEKNCDIGLRPAWDHVGNIRTLIFQGINYFHRYDTLSPNYHAHEFCGFKKLFAMSRHDDALWNSFIDNCEKMGVVFDLETEDPDAIAYYARRKLEECTPITTLDCHILANAFHADLYIYYTSSYSWTESADFQFVSRSEYNYDRMEPTKRPKWVIVLDTDTGIWYPILSELKENMSYLYRKDNWATYRFYEDNRVPQLK